MTTTYTPSTATRPSLEQPTALQSRLQPTLVEGVRVHPVRGERQVLTPGALDLVAELHRRFEARRQELLQARVQRRAQIQQGQPLDHLPHTAHIRQDPTWQVAPPAPGLSRRYVEITGPVNRAMAINALNSGADVWMADLEDATSPTWENMIRAQLNLIRFATDTLDFTSPEGRTYRLTPTPPTVMMRPRGWHLPEKHLRIDGQVPAAALVDVGLFFHHCAQRLIDAGQGPYFYLPKLESHQEARLWNEIFCFLQDAYGIPRGTIRATVLIETLPAALEMEEILYELREHSAGLNAGRWDYIFSVIKTIPGAGAMLPDRADITMTTPFMRSYCEHLVAICHRRGAHAIGGMNAFVPSRTNERANAIALQRVLADKTRDAEDGFDGGWVAHPDLVPVAQDAFARVLRGRDHQLQRQRHDPLDAHELVNIDSVAGGVTAQGLRSNIRLSLYYLGAWLQGRGTVAIDGLMEDAATVEISRTQVWHWLHSRVRLEEGLDVTPALVDRLIAEESARIEGELGADPAWLARAAHLFRQVAMGQTFAEFFTLPAYDQYV